MQYFLSLGSNINAEANIIFAIEQINKILANTKYSSIHKTKAEGFEGDDFLNLVVAGEVSQNLVLISLTKNSKMLKMNLEEKEMSLSLAQEH